MTNIEMLHKKFVSSIDEEYQKYLKSLHIPTKEQWLKMEYKFDEIPHKFNVGDVISSKEDMYSKPLTILITGVDTEKKEYQCMDRDENVFTYSIEYIDKNFKRSDDPREILGPFANMF